MIAMTPTTRARRSPRRVGLGLCLVGLCVLCPPGCADGAPGEVKAADRFTYQNVLFPNVVQIPAPVMTPEHSQPAVSWPATDQLHVICAIFSERIGVRDSHITNPDKIVWIWHTGLGTGREGNVLYEHGISSPGAHGKPAPLPKGTYYWAVWALDVEGLPSHASQEYVHTVK